MANLARPSRPQVDGLFLPAPELEEWTRLTFIEEGGDLENESHTHLRFARIGFLWAAPQWKRRGQKVLASAEAGSPPSSVTGWRRDRLAMQSSEWFGDAEVDFMITVWAPAWDGLGDHAACALIEHELYHCAQATDQWGAPKFRKSGLPAFSIRGHDIEEFVGVVSRYGAWSEGLAQMESAFKATGERLGLAAISGACGTCKAA
jgi:hypothetical protein